MTKTQMKIIQSVVFVCATALVLMQSARAAGTFSVTPAAVSNTYSGYITLQIQGLTNTETVVVQKFLDLNTNGIIDSSDWLVQQFTLTDGSAGMVIGGVTNVNVPGDLNAATGAITATLNFNNGDSLQNISGQYLFKLSSPAGHFAPITNRFAVTNLPYAQGFTGNVVSNGTSFTVSNAVVHVQGNGQDKTLIGVVANNAGSYTIQIPPGTYYALNCMKNNFISANNSTVPELALTTGQMITTNLALTSATASISGSVVDASTGMVLPGVVQTADSSTGQSGQMAFTITDTNGNFSMPVTAAGQWALGSQNVGALNVHGYVGWANGTNVSAGATGVTLAFPKATALIYGNVKDNLGNPLPNIEVDAYDSNNNYTTIGFTDLNGYYVLGVLGGLTGDSWSVTVNGPLNYSFSVQTNNGIVNLNQAIKQNFTATFLPLQVTSVTGTFGTHGVAYSQQLTAAYGQPPYNWSLISGSLPSGLSLTTNGLISGTPTNNGTFNFTVKVTDALSAMATQANTVTVAGLFVVLQPTNNSVTATIGNNVTFSAAVTGIGPFTYQWQLNGTNLPNGIITTVAGKGTYGYSGDGGMATNAQLQSPQGVAVDTKGNVFIADTGNQRIRQVDTNGMIITIAGNGTNSYLGDGGMATNAELNSPYSLAVDSIGNIIIADENNLRIRKVGTNGIIQTVAGNGNYGSSSGGAATNTPLKDPVGVTVDPTGDFFIADQGTYRVSEVGTNGIFNTLAGDGHNGPGYLNNPIGVAVDANGNLFVADADNSRIVVIANGTISTVAGNGTNGHSGDGGAAVNAELNYPTGVAVDATGNLFIADSGNNVIREVDINGIINTVAGNGTGDYFGDGGVATNAELDNPSGVAVDASGNLFIADQDNSVIREVVFQGSTLALTNVGFTNNGAYDVVVSSPYGSVTSSVVNLIVTLTSAQYTATPTNGSAPLSVQFTSPGMDNESNSISGWNWTFGDGGTSTNQNPSHVYSNVGTYQAGFLATNSQGYVVLGSGPSISVEYPPLSVVWLQPTNGLVTVAAGSSVSLTVSAPGTGQFSYQWQLNGTDLIDGFITTVAGGYIGNEVMATDASLLNPVGVTADKSGNLWIADTGQQLIRKMAANGLITTVAGNGTNGYSGDGGAATNASLNNPTGVAVDAFGNLFIADAGNGFIRKVDTHGVITTVVGGGNDFPGNGEAATNVSLSNPQGVALDSFGNVFIADMGYNVIQRVDTQGLITIVAGNGEYDYSGDGGAATNASLNNPSGVVVDAVGNLYIADAGNGVIRKVGTNGIITTFAGGGATSIWEDQGRAATNASLSYPSGVAWDGAGNLFIADASYGLIYRVDPQGIIMTVAGGGAAYLGDGGAAANGSLANPQGVAVNASGILFVADTGNNRIRQVNTNGIITTAAGGYLGDGVAAANTSLNNPEGVALDAFGDLYFADSNNQLVRKVNASGLITTVAGNAINSYSGDAGPATNASLSSPAGLAADGIGNIFIADAGNNRIRKVDTNGFILTVAGGGNDYPGNGEAATNVSLNNPQGVAVDMAGNLFIADAGYNRIRRVGVKGLMTTVAGNGTNAYSGDGGAATNASLNNPLAVAVDASGNLFIADTGNNCIREVDTNGLITTVAGNGNYGFAGDGGPATNANLANPLKVAVDTSGDLFIADYGNNRIREVANPEILGPTLVLNEVNYLNVGTYDVVVSNSSGSGTSSEVNVVLPLHVTTTALPGVINGVAYSQPLTASGGQAPYTWTRISGALPPGLTLAANGVISGVSTSTGTNQFTVKVTDTFSETATQSLELTVGNPPSVVWLQPTNGLVTVAAGSNVSLSVSVAGAGPFSYQWQLNGTDLTDGIITTVVGGYVGNGVGATEASLLNPVGVTADKSGNLWIVDTGHQLIRKMATNGLITTVAGNGTNGYSGDGGAATHASLNNPTGVAVDTFGNLFIADTGNGFIRKVDTLGVITTVAGNGTNGYSGDGGAATNATLGNPWGVAVDADENVYLADIAYSIIRQVNAHGIITTVAGGGSIYLGDGGAATNASLANPQGVAVNASGILFVADTGNNRIRQLNTNGIITTAAGGYLGNGVAAANASLNNPQGVALDALGDLYFSDSNNQLVRKVNASGLLTTVAGNAINGYAGDGGPATKASLSNPAGVSADVAGNLFIADAGNGFIRKVDTNGFITTVAGGGPDYPGDGEVATNISLNNPQGVAVDVSGNLFLADTGDNLVRQVGLNGFITTVAGNGTNGYSGDGGAATNACLNNPSGVAVDAAGNLFIADVGNGLIRKVGTQGIITTVAGGGSDYPGNGEAATNVSLNYPVGVAVDVNGNLLITDAGYIVILRVDTNGIITTVAGNGNYGYSGDGGAATNASLANPQNVAADASGDWFIADSGNNRIREVINPEILGPTLVLNDVNYRNIGWYDVVVSGPFGTTTSSSNNLAVTLPLPTLRLTGIGFKTNGGFVISVSGQSEQAYTLQASTDLVSWGSILNFTCSNSPMFVVDSAAKNYKHRFYRLVQGTLAITGLNPVVLSAPRINGGITNFTFQLSGPAGSNYVLQVSTNLLDWSSVSTSTIPGNGTVNLTNAISGSTRCFYRVLLQ